MNNSTIKKLQQIDVKAIEWKSTKKEGLYLEYAVAIHKKLATELFNELENTLEYFTGDLAKIKYKDGNDHMGEHRDNEPELDPKYPIASISLGQERDFVLKHKDARKPGKEKALIPPVKIILEHGSVLFMNPPTNEIWYHSLPVRKRLLGSRINLTFRKMRRI